MNRLSDFLMGTKVIDEVESPINGKITVCRSLGLGTYLQVGGLTQSGGILVSIWKKTLESLKKKKPEVNSCLVLGLGGGTVVQLLRKLWPDCSISGVDFDSTIVELGKKYLGLSDVQVKTYMEDAFGFCERTVKDGKKFDLILIDLYKGSEFPVQFEGEEFPKLIQKMLRDEGVAVFNRLYSADKRPKAVKFGNGLEKIFKKVEAFYPEANVMYICSG